MQNRNYGQLLLAGLLMGWLGAAAILLGSTLRLIGGQWVPAASVAALCLLALKPVATRLMRWAEVPRAEVVATASLLATAPLLLFGALNAITTPIVEAPPSCGLDLRNGSGLLLGLVFLVPLGFIFLGMSGLVSIVAFHRERRWLDAFLRGAGFVAMAASAILLVASFARRAKHPDADHYLSSLPVVATVPPVSGAPSEVHGTTSRYDTTIGDYAIRRFCTASDCDAYLAPAGVGWPDGDRPKADALRVAAKASILLRRDANNDLLIAESLGASGSTPRFAYKGPRLEPAGVRVFDVHASLSPPLGWCVGAAIGILLTLFCQKRRMNAPKKSSRLAIVELDAFALASVVLTAMPLLAAWIHGIVF